MQKVDDTGTLDETKSYARIESRAAAMQRRKVICRRVAMMTPFALIVAVWLFPFWEIGYITWDGHFFSTIIWSWGWKSSEAGWFLLDLYSSLDKIIFFIIIALVYATIISVLMVRQAFVARQGGRGSRIHLVVLIVASCQLAGGTFLRPMLWLAVTQFIAGITLWAAYAFLSPTPGETHLFRTAAMAASKASLDMQKMGDLTKNDVDEVRGNLDRLNAIARVAGVDIYDELKVGYNTVPKLEVRCNLNEITWIGSSISTDQLLAISGLTKEQFDALLPDMCREFALSTDGKTVSAKVGQSTSELMHGIDFYFVRWRQVEAEKLGKM